MVAWTIIYLCKTSLFCNNHVFLFLSLCIIDLFFIFFILKSSLFTTSYGPTHNFVGDLFCMNANNGTLDSKEIIFV
jgi:hypothetical protein